MSFLFTSRCFFFLTTSPYSNYLSSPADLRLGQITKGLYFSVAGASSVGMSGTSMTSWRRRVRPRPVGSRGFLRFGNVIAITPIEKAICWGEDWEGFIFFPLMICNFPEAVFVAIACCFLRVHLGWRVCVWIRAPKEHDKFDLDFLKIIQKISIWLPG